MIDINSKNDPNERIVCEDCRFKYTKDDMLEKESDKKGEKGK